MVWWSCWYLFRLWLWWYCSCSSGFYLWSWHVSFRRSPGAVQRWYYEGIFVPYVHVSSLSVAALQIVREQL